MLNILLGLVMLIIEYILYQKVDANGVLQESLFLPLGTANIILGLVILAIRAFHKT